jgi:hypothetical protein
MRIPSHAYRKINFRAIHRLFTKSAVNVKFWCPGFGSFSNKNFCPRAPRGFGMVSKWRFPFVLWDYRATWPNFNSPKKFGVFSVPWRLSASQSPLLKKYFFFRPSPFTSLLQCDFAIWCSGGLTCVLDYRTA